MLTREQIQDEIVRLEALGQVGNHTNEERVQLARLYICTRYIALRDEKNASIDNGTVLSWDYDRRLLILIRNILIHTRDNWDLETDEQRKGSLNNLVRTILLLRREFTSLYNLNYSSQIELSETINLWRNFGFLIQCQISPQDPGVNQRFPISFDEINAILEEAFLLIDAVLYHEIRNGLWLQGIKCDMQARHNLRNQYKILEENVRKPYRDPHALCYLHAFTSYKREQFYIEKMLQAIRFSLTLNLTNPTHQMALLRQIQIIGESITGKNLSAQTKRLVNDIDWQLLVRLRNKLSHNEWDIHQNLLMKNLVVLHNKTKSDLAQFIRRSIDSGIINGETAKQFLRLHSIKKDLEKLEISLHALAVDHQTIGDIPRHYSSVWHLRDITRNAFVQFYTTSMQAGVINGTQEAEWLDSLNEDIRRRDIPIEDIKPVIEPFFGNHPALAGSFQALVRTFRSEQAYHRNLENPDAHEQERIAIRLAPHQIGIRSLHDLLAYSQETYDLEYQNHPHSFDPLRIINLIRQEITSMHSILQPLPGNTALGLIFNEDVTSFQNANLINRLLICVMHIYGNVSPSIVQAINNIRNYFHLIQKPLCLEIDGLHGVERGAMITLDPEILFGRIPDLLNPIRTFGNKCLFYSSLVNHPEMVEACVYHMARVQKYMVVLRLNETHPNQLPHFKEFKALRDFIHHGLDLFETMNIPLYKFMSRYASMFIGQLLPAINNMEHRVIQDRIRQRPNVNAVLLQYDAYRQTTEQTNNKPRTLSLSPTLRRTASAPVI